MQPIQRLSIQAEITLDNLLQAITHLSFQDKLTLEKALRKKLLEEQMQDFIASAPKKVLLSGDDIMAEVKAVRNAQHG